MSDLREPLSDDDSFVHRLDPRGKVIIAGLFAVIIAVAQSIPTVLAGLSLTLFCIALARLPLKKVIVRFLPVNGFVLLLWPVLPLTYPGEAVFTLGSLSATHEGLVFAGLITLKSNTIIIALIALVATVPVITLGQAMHMMHIPDKLCHLLLFTYRYIYVFEGEFHRLVEAMKVRGFQPRTNLHTYRSYAYLAAMLLVRSYDRAHSVFNAILCRGFHGVFYSLRTFSRDRRDGIFVVSSLLALALLLYLEWRMPGLRVRLG